MLWSAYVSCETLEQGRKLFGGLLAVCGGIGEEEEGKPVFSNSLKNCYRQKVFPICLCVQNSLFRAAILGMHVHTFSRGRVMQKLKKSGV